MDVLRKELKKPYQKMMRKYKKKFKKLAKDVSPWDYGFGLELFIEHLRFMRDYYHLGYNVWAEEEENELTREEMLNLILKEYDAWMTCDEKYLQSVCTNDPNWEDKKCELISQGYYEDDNKTRLKQFQSPRYEIIFFRLYKDNEENMKKLQEEYAYHRTQFFALLGKYIEKIWD